MTEKFPPDDSIAAVENAIIEAKRVLDKAAPGPSREKSLVHTKLDEALMWAREIP